MTLRAWWQVRKLRKRQRTWIYCPTCHFEMVWGGTWLGQDPATLHEGYRCVRCGTMSEWDFDTFPVPIRIGEGEG